MDLLHDERFAAVAKDPRFRRIPKQERKVKIDKRFKGMFTDKRFKLKYSVDKRGRPEDQTSSENLRKFYELSESDESDDAHGNEHIREDDDSDDSNDIEDDALERQEHDGTVSTSRHHYGKTGAPTQQCTGKERRRSGREMLKEFKRRKARTSASTERMKKSVQTALSPKKSSNSNRDTRMMEKTNIPRQFEAGGSSSEENEEYFDSDEKESGLGIDDSGGKKLRKNSDSKSEAAPSWQKQIGIDLARGEGNIETSSSESDSDEEIEEARDRGKYVAASGEGISHSWGELDTDAPRNEKISRRLALCNMDWDRLTATDLFVLLNSFKPKGGILHSVKIYPSEFGLKRMQEEDSKGPQELVQKDEKMKKPDGVSEERYHREKLRKYQMQRLKYFYAVLECDTADTASAIYDQCDGMEYESSSSRLDLRFIPDDMTFDHEPKDITTEVPDVAVYKPTEFQTTALQQSRVELTWDEMDKKRAQKTAEAFNKKNIEEIESHMQAYLASSSEGEDDDEEEDASGREEDRVDSKPMREEDRIDKYRNLLRGIEEKEKQDKEDKEMEMEISWEPGLKETTEKIVKKKSEAVGSTPWEQYLEKKKDKKKDRKDQQKKKKELQKMPREAPGDEDLAFSDDDLPGGIDLSDSYFRDSLRDMGKAAPGSKVEKSLKTRQELKTEEEIEDEKRRKAALELLMLDEDEDEDGKQHFSLKDIVENENMTKSKRKRQQRKLGKAQSAAVQDSFNIDTKDPRFNALFTSHEYAIDPSDSQFKKTKAMDALITEKQKRRWRKEMAGDGDVEEKKQVMKKKDVALSQLVKSIKSKTEQFHSRKKLKVDR